LEDGSACSSELFDAPPEPWAFKVDVVVNVRSLMFIFKLDEIMMFGRKTTIKKENQSATIEYTHTHEGISKPMENDKSKDVSNRQLF
jgi:hypothetical protein